MELPWVQGKERGLRDSAVRNAREVEDAGGSLRPRAERLDAASTAHPTVAITTGTQRDPHPVQAIALVPGR